MSTGIMLRSAEVFVVLYPDMPLRAQENIFPLPSFSFLSCPYPPLSSSFQLLALMDLHPQPRHALQGESTSSSESLSQPSKPISERIRDASIALRGAEDINKLYLRIFKEADRAYGNSEYESKIKMVEETLKLQSQEMAYQELKNRPNHEAVDNRDDRRRAAGGRSNSLENYYLAIQKDYMYTVGSLNNGSQATRRDTLRKETEKKTRIRRACRYAAESLWEKTPGQLCFLAIRRSLPVYFSSCGKLELLKKSATKLSGYFSLADLVEAAENLHSSSNFGGEGDADLAFRYLDIVLANESDLRVRVERALLPPLGSPEVVDLGVSAMEELAAARSDQKDRSFTLYLR